MTQPKQQDRFVALIDEHRKILFKVAGSYARQPADREDLIQEMVLQMWRSFERYDETQRFSTWMYRVALNVAISFYRRETRRSRVLLNDERLIETAAAPSEHETHEALATLQRLIEGLNEFDRALVICTWTETHTPTLPPFSASRNRTSEPTQSHQTGITRQYSEKEKGHGTR
jgi:RNA polymerase sigma-70 factor (ECF subfamily)